MWIGCYKSGTLLLSLNPSLLQESLLLESLPAPWIPPCSLNPCSLNLSLLLESLPAPWIPPCSLNHSLLFGSLCCLSLNLFGCPTISRFSFIQFLASLCDVLTLPKLGSLGYIFAVAWRTQFVSFLLFFAFIDLWVMCLILIWRSLFLISVPVLLGVLITLSLAVWWEVWASQWDLISAH